MAAKRFVAQFRQTGQPKWVDDDWWDDYDSAETHVILTLINRPEFTHGRVFDRFKKQSSDILSRADAENLYRLAGE